MKNKESLKKYIILNMSIVLLFGILFGISNWFQYKVYTKNVNQTINTIIQEITKKYPEITTNELMSILNQKELKDTNILEKYGIDLEKDSVILANDFRFQLFIIMNIAILFLMVLCLLFAFWKYQQKRNKKLKEITQYIEQINQKNYQLDIQDNTEDELSILKNEIYKTTILLKEQAENSMEDKKNLKDSLSDISHQLKTPLTSMNIMLDNIIDNPNMDTKTRNEFLKDMDREIANINFLVQSLLKLSKFEANIISFAPKKMKMKDLIEKSIQNISVLCDLKDIKIIVTGNLKAQLYCDENWQVEAITNILKNCIEHSKEHTQIMIQYEENKMYSKIVIEDQGRGIAKEDLPHIFERFYQGKNVSNNSMGIGLSLAKTIIEKQGGYITAESEEGIGSKFLIRYMK